MANFTSTPSTTSINIFQIGQFATKVKQVTNCNNIRNEGALCVPPPPKPLLIASPLEDGLFPVLLFLHGFLLSDSFYSQLIQHIASHGFIVVAPQLHFQSLLVILYSIAGPDTTEEINSTTTITNWLFEALHHFLPLNVRPDFERLALAGHSRGGKVAFALALSKSDTSLKFSALIGIDPVDGMAKGKQTPPHVLTYVPQSFDLDMAVLVIGSGLGEVKKNLAFPPCAPKGVNHEDFYNECRKPACYFVASDYGHLDMLDDETKGIRGRSTYCLCKNGKTREPMRLFVGGVVVAFLKAYLEGNSCDLVAIRDGAYKSPVELQKAEIL